MVIYPDGTHYIMVHKDDIAEIVEEHLLEGPPRDPAADVEEGTNKPVESLTDTNFYRQQQPRCPAQLRRHRPREH